MRSRDEEPVRVRGSQSLDDVSCSSAITGQPLVVRGAKNSNGSAPQAAAGCYILPMEYSSTSEEPVVSHTPLTCTMQHLHASLQQGCRKGMTGEEHRIIWYAHNQSHTI